MLVCTCVLRNCARTGSAWKQGEWGREGGEGRQWGEMAQTMYAHMNKWTKTKIALGTIYRKDLMCSIMVFS
jgi:hypothetical protein